MIHLLRMLHPPPPDSDTPTRLVIVAPALRAMITGGILVSTLPQVGCSTRQAFVASDTPGTSIHRGPDYALRVPTGATVRPSSDGLQVDAPDGTHWFDIHSTSSAPEALIDTWVRETCTTILWDAPVEPIPDTWTMGGLCRIDTRDHWVFTVVERDEDGDRALVSIYAARRDAVPFEGAWLDMIETTLSLRAGEAPLEPFPEERLRAEIRGAAAEGRGPVPVPGGGVLSGRISQRLTDLWTTRHASPMPTFASNPQPKPIPPETPKRTETPGAPR